MSLRSVVQTIEEAAKDDRVKGFVATGDLLSVNPLFDD